MFDAYEALPTDINYGLNLKCHVCGDNNASKHYGGICCSGCKAFFRRTVVKNTVYTCAYDDNRNFCRACRYKKCIEVGLLPSTIQGSRKDKIARKQLALAKTESVNRIKQEVDDVEVNDVPTSPNTLLDIDQTYVETLVLAHKYLSRDYRQPLGHFKIIPRYSTYDFKSVMKYYVLAERICEAYTETSMTQLDKEFEKLCSINVSTSEAIRYPKSLAPRTPMNWESKTFISCHTFQKIWCRGLGQYFDWVSHIPEMHELSGSDRERLIIGRLNHSIMFTLSYKSAITNTPGLLFGGSSYFPIDEYQQKHIDPATISLFKTQTILMKHALVDPIRDLRVTEAEYAIMHLLIMFMPVNRLSQEGIQKIQTYKQRYVNTLNELISASYKHVDPIKILKRLSGLMDILCAVERVTQHCDDVMFSVTLFNMAEMRGTLPYEVYIRKNDPEGVKVKEFM